VQNAPVELQELYYPVMIEQHRLREGSGGASRFRGGLSIEITVRALCDAFVNINVERTLTPPWGLFGGHAANRHGLWSSKTQTILEPRSPNDLTFR
jgi:N-methylhydantoinase B